MARIQIPNDVGECEIFIARAGNYAVRNHKTGKNKFICPCRDLQQAEELLRRIQQKDHDGEIRL